MNWQPHPSGAPGAPDGEFGPTQGNTPAGWYPDSNDPSLLRYWDGTQWSEHTAPGQAATETIYRQDAAPAPGYEPQPGPPGYGPAGTGGPAPAPPGSAHAQPGYGEPGYGAPGSPHAGSGAAANGGQKHNVGMLAGIGAGAVILVILLVIIGINLFGGDDGPEADPTPVETDDGDDIDSDDPLDGTGEDPVETTSFVPGDTVSGTVPEDGEWIATMTLNEDTIVILDVGREHSALDPTLTVRDGNGSEIITNDDRASALTFILGSRFNPYVTIPLEAGEYTVAVGSYRSLSEGDFVMVTSTSSTIQPGQQDVLNLSDGQYGGYAVDIAEAGTYTLAASVDSGEAAIVLFDDGGIRDSNHGSGSASITVDLEPGLHSVLAAEEVASATTMTFTVESE